MRRKGGNRTSPSWSLNTGRVRCRNRLESATQFYFQEAKNFCDNVKSTIENVYEFEQVKGCNKVKVHQVPNRLYDIVLHFIVKKISLFFTCLSRYSKGQSWWTNYRRYNSSHFVDEDGELLRLEFGDKMFVDVKGTGKNDFLPIVGMARSDKIFIC